MQDVLKGLIQMFPFAVLVCFGMALVKLSGAMELSWWQVTAPVWGSYIAVLATIMGWLLIAVVQDKVVEHLTAQRERGKLEK